MFQFYRQDTPAAPNMLQWLEQGTPVMPHPVIICQPGTVASSSLFDGTSASGAGLFTDATGSVPFSDGFTVGAPRASSFTGSRLFSHRSLASSTQSSSINLSHTGATPSKPGTVQVSTSDVMPMDSNNMHNLTTPEMNVDSNNPNIVAFNHPASAARGFLTNMQLLHQGILSEEAVKGIERRCQEMDDKDDEDPLK